jgi:hypothetical protein
MVHSAFASQHLDRQQPQVVRRHDLQTIYEHFERTTESPPSGLKRRSKYAEADSGMDEIHRKPRHRNARICGKHAAGSVCAKRK